MRKRRNLFVGILFVLIPAFAAAQTQFTMAEQTQIANLRNAQFGLFDVLAESCGVSGNEVDCQRVNLAAYQMGQGIGWLLHINVHENTGNRTPPSGGWAVLAGPRSNVVATAWAALDVAKATLQQAASFASDPKVVAAVNAITSVNRSLGYANPLPAFPVSGLGTDPENQFGPHGHYSEDQVALWGGFRYSGHAAIDSWLKALASGELPPCPPLPFPQPQIDHKRQVVKLLAQFSKRSMQLIQMSAKVYSPAAGFPDWISAYRTDTEEILAEPAKSALTEIHIGAGPADNIGSNLFTAKELLAGGGMAAGTCLMAASSAPTMVQVNVGRFFLMLEDGWRRHLAWYGSFNVIR